MSDVQKAAEKAAEDYARDYTPNQARIASDLKAHPLQPVYLDKHGVVRFQQNAIVRFLLDAGPFDLNQIACMPFEDVDREQLAQLIGYSVSGFGELEYASDKSVELADKRAENCSTKDNNDD